MEPPSPPAERRTHPRAPLRLPARIRWQGPLGMRVEMTETVDVSREGVLVRRKDACELLSRVWVVFPLVRGAGISVQPETPGRVARVVPAEGGGYWVGVRVENADRNMKRPTEHERRRSERVPCALPIFLRLVGTPWPEESMTRDLSSKGVRFETSHLYTPGQAVIAQIPWGEWSLRGQIQGRVVRVDPLGAPPARAVENMAVAVEWLDQSAATQS
jgi:hypothetical protein